MFDLRFPLGRGFAIRHETPTIAARKLKQIWWDNWKRGAGLDVSSPPLTAT
jgi:hypothetical protein